MEKHEVLKKYENWRKQYPDDDYRYDRIIDFFKDLSRGEILSFMEWVSGAP